MRRSLAAAGLALATIATPASAAIEPWKIVGDLIGECMDCFPQIVCLSPRPECPLDAIIVPPLP